MGQNQSTAATEEPYHKRHYTATNRQIQRQNSISITSPTHLLQNPGPNPLRDYALKRQGTLSMQSSSTVNLHSSTLSMTTGSGVGRSGVAGDNSNNTGATEGGDGARPFIRLLPIEIPQPVYFDESSASEEDDYEYDDGGDGEYSDDYLDSNDYHPHSRQNSSHLRRHRRHRSNTHEYSDDNTDLVEHDHHRNNKRGLASSPSPSPSYLDTVALNGRTTSSSSGVEHHDLSMSREQVDYRQSKEEEEEDFSYLSPVSGKRRFAKPTYPRGGLQSEPYYPPNSHHLDLDHGSLDLTNNQNLTDDTSDDEAYNEELFLKRYQLRDVPSRPHNSVQSSDGGDDGVTDSIISQLDISSSSSSMRSPTSTTLILDAIREEKEQEDDEESGIPSSLPSRSSKTQGEKEGGPVSVSPSNNSLKETSRMGYSLHHAQPLQEANNQHSSNNFNILNNKGDNNNSCSFGAHKSSPLPPLDSSSPYQYQQEEQEQRRASGGERFVGDGVRTDLDLLHRHGKAVHLQQEQSLSQGVAPTATGSISPCDTATPPTLAPRPPKSDGDVLVVVDNEEQGIMRSMHSPQGSTTLRKEMLSNVSQRVGDLDSRVNQMDALVSYKLTDIESKVQVLHDGQDNTAQDTTTFTTAIATAQDTTPLSTSTSSSSEPQHPSLSFAEGEQPLHTTPSLHPAPNTTRTSNRTSQLLDKASLLELRLELQAFGMRFHELNDSLLIDLMTQMRQAKLMLFESTSSSLDPITAGGVVRRVDKAEAEMHARLLSEIETRIQERVLAMEVTSARLEKCFDQMEARLGALEIVLVAGTGAGGSTGTMTMLKRPRPESMYKILQQQQQLPLQQREQERFQEQQQQQQHKGQEQGLRFTLGHRSHDSESSASFNNISRTNTSSSLNQKPPIGPGGPQYPRATRPTRILTTPVPHLLQQRTAPLSANLTSTVTRSHRAMTLEALPNASGPVNMVPNGHINGPISAHPLSSSLPLARHHLLMTQRSLTSLMAGPINSDPRSAHVCSSSGANGTESNTLGEGKKSRASGQKVMRRPSSYKELLHFWKAGGSTPDLLNTGDS
ncbi:hypothetical protein BGZ47_007165 [Haplosporangium gracile]|nr:hypothetical protein BGZ47_007165 [Haplosporangium gracile]